MNNRFVFSKQLKLMYYVILSFVWMVVNLLVLFPLTNGYRFDIDIIITIGNGIGIVFLPFLWFHNRYAQFEKMPVLIRLINRHFLGILLLGMISCVVLLLAQGMNLFPIFIKIYPIQMLLWSLLYVAIYKYEVNISKIEEKHLQIDELIPERNKELIETIAVKTGKKLHIIQIKEVVCFQAYGDYVNVMTLQGTYLKEQTLKYFEEHLPENQFIRVHRSYIANIHSIEAIERFGREQYLLILSNKEKIKATPEGYRRLREMLKL